MPNHRITIEIDGHHTFDVEVPGHSDLVMEARSVLADPCVVEEHEGDSFTVYPVSRVTAVYVGEASRRRVGFPSIPAV